MFSDVWTIALAAGAGRRLARLTAGVPKQFWRPPGTSASLLHATLERLRPLAVPDRTMTVVDESHRGFVEAFPDHGFLGEVVYQPLDRGTAAGVLLPLTRVLNRAPGAIVIITPSDQGVDDLPAFRAGIRQAIDRVRSGASEIVLFGVEPRMVARDCGWITPTMRERLARHTFREVARFVEKPPLPEAFRLFSSGAVLNTMVLVARAIALWRGYHEHLPVLADVFEKAGKLDGQARDGFLRDRYPGLPCADFSRDLLTPARPLCVYTWPAEIGWSDLGTPERLEEWLALKRRGGAAASVVHERPHPSHMASGKAS